jgi:FkbM family methyltransferase
VRADIRDHELLVGVLERTLEHDSDCLDVGAHTGSVLREMVTLSPHGRHLAWEPLQPLARRLAAEFPSVEVRQAALSDRPGEREFAHVLDDPGWSGFVARPARGGAVETIVVRCERLDDVLPAEARPAFLKVDVEGAEEEVLRGAAETLRRHHPLIAFEHGLGSADHYGTAPEAMHDLLAGLGYEVYGLDDDGPYSRKRFAEIFAGGERVNFLAR